MFFITIENCDDYDTYSMTQIDRELISVVSSNEINLYDTITSVHNDIDNCITGELATQHNSPVKSKTTHNKKKI